MGQGERASLLHHHQEVPDPVLPEAACAKTDGQ